MNTENILKLADYIEKELIQLNGAEVYYEPTNYKNQKFFYMNDYLQDVSNNKHKVCGTAGCIAGSVIMLKGDAKNYAGSDFDIAEEATEFLGLTTEQSEQLFTPNTITCAAKGNDYKQQFGTGHIRQEHAVYVLRKLVEHEKHISHITIPSLWQAAFENLGE